MKTKSVVLIVTLVIFISFGISTFSSLIFLNKLIEQNNEENAQIFTNEIYESILETLSESMAVSESINNTFVRNIINNHDDYSAEQLSQTFGDYLHDVTRQFGYDTAFIVTDWDRTYYTEWGRMKSLDPTNPDDDWYDNFVATGEANELHIDNDQANDNRITVYINIRMEDEHGNFIGACGVGHVLNSLNEMIDNLEREHELSIQLVAKDGIIQVAGNDSLCAQQASNVTLGVIGDAAKENGYHFEKFGSNGYRVSKYLSEYRWYLYVEHNSGNDEVSKILLQDLLACLISLIIMVFIISIAMKTQEEESMSFKLNAETDNMTGLYNRRAFDDEFDRIRAEDRIRDYSVCVIDINGLKQINDNIGHEAGDELIRGGAECISNVVGDHGRIYRIGGDEFAIITNEPIDNVEDSALRIKNEVSKWHGEYSDTLSMAIGIVRGSDHEDATIDELFKLADKEMYRDKEEFYKDKRYDRRHR